MRSCLSFPDTLIAITLAGFLCAPQALALVSDYSTDMGEPDIMTVKNSYCCMTPEMKQEVNVQINIEDALISSNRPVHISILNDKQQEINAFNTRDRYVYMRLPEGHYTIKVDGENSHSALNVAANDTTLQSYIIQPLYSSYAQAGANRSAFLQPQR